MRSKTAFTGFAAIVVALIASLSASAAFPGNNGKIVFGSQHAGEDEIWVMDADGTDRQNLTRHDGAKISDIDPRWSPDGRQIVFASDPTGSMQIWVMNANGSGATQLTNLPGRNRYPAFTADGKQIAFQSLVNGNFEIYRMNVDGSEVTNLTNDSGVDWSPATSSRGKKIVFTSERDGNGHLYIWSPDKPLVRVTNTAGYDYFANWSPNGNDLVFIRNEGNGDDVYFAHADGTGTRRLTNTPGQTEWFPAFSPDGSKIVYTACIGFKPPSAPNPTCASHAMNLDGSGDVDLAFPPAAVTFPFSDNFDDSSRDIELWGNIHDGVGASIQEVNGRVEVSFAADASPVPGQSGVGAHTGFSCILNGDFDAEVDYELLDWPAANGVSVQLHAFFGGAAVYRESQTWGESYGSFVQPSFGNAVPTLDQAGALRLVRNGGTMTSYYRSGGAWVPLVSAPASSSGVIVALVATSHGTFGHQAVRVAFDNFRLDATNVDCTSSRPDLHPDWQPIK